MFPEVLSRTPAIFSTDFSGCGAQCSGHILTEDGVKVIRVDGMWNSYLDMQKCDAEGEALPDEPKTRLWEVGQVLCT